LPGNVEFAISKLLEQSLDMPRVASSAAVEATMKRVPEFVKILGEEVNRVRPQYPETTGKWASMLDSVADSLELRGYVKEAENLDIIANAIEAGVFSPAVKSDEGKEELRRTLTEHVKSTPGYLANKVGIIKKDDAGRKLYSDEGRVYTPEKPTELSHLWKEGPDSNWYLQNAGDAYEALFIGDKGYLEDSGGQKHPVPGLKEVTNL